MFSFHSILFTFFFLFLLNLSPTKAQAKPKLENMPVQNVFFPPDGYTNLENVQMVIEGALPDPCFVLDKFTATIDPDTHFVSLHQSAWRREDGVCGNGDLLSEGAYSVEISLGRLSPGNYAVVYYPDSSANPRSENRAIKTLNVKAANAPSISDPHYSRITAVKMLDLFFSNTIVSFTVSGTFVGKCRQLLEPLNLQVEAGAIIMLPAENADPNCKTAPDAPKSWEKTVSLGMLAPGEYLLHIRATGGQALERTFTVLGSN